MIASIRTVSLRFQTEGLEMLTRRTEKLFSAIVKQNVYQQELLRAVQDVTKHTLKVREAANQCLAARQQRMHRTVIDTYGKVDETWKLMQSQYEMLKEATVTAIRNCG